MSIESEHLDDALVLRDALYLSTRAEIETNKLELDMISMCSKNESESESNYLTQISQEQNIVSKPARKSYTMLIDSQTSRQQEEYVKSSTLVPQSMQKKEAGFDAIIHSNHPKSGHMSEFKQVVDGKVILQPLEQGEGLNQMTSLIHSYFKSSPPIENIQHQERGIQKMKLKAIFEKIEESVWNCLHEQIAHLVHKRRCPESQSIQNSIHNLKQTIIIQSCWKDFLVENLSRDSARVINLKWLKFSQPLLDTRCDKSQGMLDLSKLIDQLNLGFTLLKSDNSLCCLTFIHRAYKQSSEVREEISLSKLQRPAIPLHLQCQEEVKYDASGNVQKPPSSIKYDLQSPQFKQSLGSSLEINSSVSQGLNPTRTTQSKINEAFQHSSQSYNLLPKIHFRLSDYQTPRHYANMKPSCKDLEEVPHNQIVDIHTSHTLANQRKTKLKLLKMESQLTTSKLFMNMVVHDLRNPSESIQQGLTLGKDLLNTDLNTMIQDLNDVLNRVINDATSNDGSSIISQPFLASQSNQIVRTLTSHELKMGEVYSDLDSKNLLENLYDPQSDCVPNEKLSKISENSLGMSEDFQDSEKYNVRQSNQSSQSLKQIAEERSKENVTITKTPAQQQIFKIQNQHSRGTSSFENRIGEEEMKMQGNQSRSQSIKFEMPHQRMERQTQGRPTEFAQITEKRVPSSPSLSSSNSDCNSYNELNQESLMVMKNIEESKGQNLFKNLPRGEDTHDNIAKMTDNRLTRPEVVFVIKEVVREPPQQPQRRSSNKFTDVDYENYVKLMNYFDQKMGTELSVTDMMLKKDQVFGSEKPMSQFGLKAHSMRKQKIENASQRQCQSCQRYQSFLFVLHEKLIQIRSTTNQFMQNSIFSAFMMTNLINDLLDQAKLEKKVFKLNEDYFNLFDVVVEAFQIVTFQAEAKNIDLLLEFDQSRPFIFRKIYSDKRRMLQILLNFISNSIKFTNSHGYIKLKLELLEEQPHNQQLNNLMDPIQQRRYTHRKQSQQYADKSQMINHVKEEHKYIKMNITIEDNGVGIKPENIDKLFMDFSKLDEHHAMNIKGTGLGLSICRNIIKRMGGIVKVESKVNVGTKFLITLRLRAIDISIESINTKQITNDEKVRILGEMGAFMYTSDFTNEFDLDENKCRESSPNNQKPPPNQEGLIDQQLDTQILVYKFNTMKEQNKKKVSKEYQQRIKQLRSKAELIKSQNTKKKIRDQFKSRRELKKEEVDSWSTIKFVQEGPEVQTKEEAKKPSDQELEFIFKFVRNSVELSESAQTSEALFEGTPSMRGQQQKKKKALSDSTVQTNRNYSDNSPKNSYEIDMSISKQDQLDSFGVRKLKILVANDNSYQLFILSNILRRLSTVSKVDVANNGKEALECVEESEYTKNLMAYDIIFLDLEMPILDGYEACTQILEFYKLYDRESKALDNHLELKENYKDMLSGSHQSGYQEMMWLQMLEDLYTVYIQGVPNPVPFSVQLMEKEIEEQDHPIFLLLQSFYNKVKYHTLNQKNYPFIFALSGHVDDKVYAKAMQHGFHDCFKCPLQPANFDHILKSHVNPYIERYFSENSVHLQGYFIQTMNQTEQSMHKERLNENILNQQIPEMGDSEAGSSYRNRRAPQRH